MPWLGVVHNPLSIHDVLGQVYPSPEGIIFPLTSRVSFIFRAVFWYMIIRRRSLLPPGITGIRNFSNELKVRSRGHKAIILSGEPCCHVTVNKDCKDILTDFRISHKVIKLNKKHSQNIINNTHCLKNVCETPHTRFTLGNTTY